MRQEELDRFEGFWISPDGSMVAYEEVTEAHIPQSLGAEKSREEQVSIPDFLGFPRRIEKDGQYFFFLEAAKLETVWSCLDYSDWLLTGWDSFSRSKALVLDPWFFLQVDGCQGSASCIQAPVMWVKTLRSTAMASWSAYVSLIGSDVNTQRKEIMRAMHETILCP